MLCQVCGARNPEDQEYCLRCHHKLLVVSGPLIIDDVEEFEERIEESISFDEHLLERISILEEAVKRTAETVRQLLGALHKQERNILVNHTGVVTLRELLESKHLLSRGEWDDLWESRMDYQLLALEKRERFVGIKERIAALYHGDKRQLFLGNLEEAEYCLFAFDVDGAMRALEAAYKLDRGNYELACFLGETCFNEGDTEKALTYFERVLEARPDHYEGLVYGGVLHHEQGDNGRAEELLRRAVALYPDSFLAYFSLGAVHAGQEKLARAVVYLERAVELEPVPQALFLLGNCLYEMGKLTASIRTLQEAVRQDPAFEEAHHLLGLAYLDRRWNRKALDAFRSAQRLNPKRLQYQDLVRFLSGEEGGPLPSVDGEAAEWFTRGEKALSRGHAQQALTSYRRALSFDPENPTLLMSYAMLCLQLDRSQEIEALTRKVLDLEPGEMLKATAYATLIEALRSQGKYREGNRIGQRLLHEGGSNFTKTIAYYEMAYNLAEMEEDLDSALSYAQQSLDLAPEELRAFPLAALGWVHYKRREFDKAVDFLARSTELGPSATTLTHLGMALLAAGEEERARSVLAHARSLDRQGGALGVRMLEVMKESTRLLERVRSRQRK
jgi:tetratricopeptide (TPR) repeat protein